MKKSFLILIFLISITFSFLIEKFIFNSFFLFTDAQNDKEINNLSNNYKTKNSQEKGIKKTNFITEEEYQKIKQNFKKQDNKKEIKSKKENNIDFNQKVVYPVFFTSQAPSGQWKNEIFQDGCEEASMLMALNWAKNDNKKLSKKQVETEIEKISLFEKEKYNFYLDVSLVDVYKIIQDYYHYSHIKFLETIKKDDLIKTLYKEAVLIVPVNGQLLNNPFFTPPGPEYHTLLIVGYNPKDKNFIVNDPGTRRGDHYHYNEDVLYKAIRDYPSGYHQVIKEEHKRAIAIYKNKKDIN